MKCINMIHKLRQKSGKLAGACGLLLTLLMAQVVVAGVNPVHAIPQMPYQLYGNVTINGTAAPPWVIVTADIGGIQYASTTTDAQGRYGYSPAFFRIPADDPSTPDKEGGVAGDTVQLSVTGVPAGTTVFAYGTIVNLNLTVSGTAPALAVNTAAATSIMTTSVILNGNLTSMGMAATVDVSFEYGTTTEYGSTTTEQEMTATGAFSASVTGLTPGTLYHFRAKADPGTTGEASGADLTFTTSTSLGVLRTLPGLVFRGQTFNAVVNFSALSDNFNGVGITDFAPTGWAVQVDDPETAPAWCTPNPMTSNAVGNRAQYAWAGPYSQGHAFTVVFKVTVPAGAALGNYQFTNGTLQYFIGSGTNPTTVNITGSNQVEVAEGALIQGETWDAKGGITPSGVLGGVTVTIDGTTFVNSDAQGAYQLIALTTGTHTLVASKTGFRSYTRTINVTNLGEAYTLKFKGTYGLIPNAPDLTYVLTCINKWKFPPEADTEQGLNLTKVLFAINAWKFPLP